MLEYIFAVVVVEGGGEVRILSAAAEERIGCQSGYAFIREKKKDYQREILVGDRDHP